MFNRLTAYFIKLRREHKTVDWESRDCKKEKTASKCQNWPRTHHR